MPTWCLLGAHLENIAELSPLAKGDVEIGKSLPFPVYDRTGQLLLAQGQAIQTERQLSDLLSKGLYHNPRWAQQATEGRKPARGSIAPLTNPRLMTSKAAVEDPSETGTSLKMSLADTTESFSVRLVGALGKEAFLVSHPMQGGKCVFVKEGQLWSFRCFYGLSIYRFTAQVEKVLLSPYPLLVLSWPHETHSEFQPIRSARRVSCDLPATVRLPGCTDEAASKNVRIRNISTGGVELEPLDAAQRLVIGEQVELAFQLNLGGRKFLLELNGTAVSEQTHPDSKKPRYGMAFGPVADTHFSAIHAYVCDRLMNKLESPLYAKENPLREA